MSDERIFDSIYSYYYLLGEKTIFSLNYKTGDGLKYLSFVTRNPKYIDSSKEKIEDNINDTESYVFYDLIEKKWIKIMFNDDFPSLGGEFHFLDEHGFDSPYLILDAPEDKIESYNNQILEMVKKTEKDYNNAKSSLIDEIKIYNKDYNSDLLEKYFILFKSREFNYNECLFSCIFDISIEEYKNNKINNFTKFKNIFKNIVNKEKEKALNKIEEESKNFLDNEEEMAEVETIKELINTSVDESLKITDETDDPSIVFETYPTILQPSPDFLEDDAGDTIYSLCREHIEDLNE